MNPLANIIQSVQPASREQNVGSINPAPVAFGEGAVVEDTVRKTSTGISAMLPAVLTPADKEVPLTEGQAHDWQDLQEDFTQAVTANGGSENDPDYQQRWKEEAEFSDQMFRSKFGTLAFIRQNLEAGRLRESK